MSQPKRNGTCGARRRATSAPRGLETPVMSTRRGITRRLWVYPSNARGVGYALDRKGVGRQAHVDPLVHRRVEDLVERPRDHVVQLGFALPLLPKERLEVLDPFEVGDDHATGVGDDVRNHENPSLVEDW